MLMFSFSFVFTRDLYNTLHYIFQGTLVLCVCGTTYGCGCIIDMSKSRVTLNIRRPCFFRCISKKKTIYIRVNTILGKAICTDSEKNLILTSSVDEAGSQVIRANINKFRQIGHWCIPFKNESNVNPLHLQWLRCQE